VVRHRWHTGIVLPADRLAPPLAFLEDQFSDPAWYEIGWGDNDFYRRTDNLWLLGKALFWPTDTVLHVVGLDKHPADLPNSDVQALCLSSDGLKRLQTTLAEDFKLGDDGQPLAADPGLYGDSRFFPARGHFWFGRTCNTWTAQRLHDGGVDIRTFMTLRAKSVMTQIRDHGQAGACAE
jgi:uncharacterized protein (TIGR02117 family)